MNGKNIIFAKNADEVLKVLGNKLGGYYDNNNISKINSIKDTFGSPLFEQERPICFHIDFPLDIEGVNEDGVYKLRKKIMQDIYDESKESKNTIGETVNKIVEDKTKSTEDKPLVDYEREYSIWELETLLKNMPEDATVEFKGIEWKLWRDDIEEEYDFEDYSGNLLSDKLITSEILKAKFKLVQPKPTGKWVSATKAQIIQAILDGKKIGYNSNEILKSNMNFAEKMEYMYDNYIQAYGQNLLQIWEGA